MQLRQPEYHARTDDDLVEAVRRDDRAAFGELYSRYRDPAYRFARTLLGSNQGADDLVAEAFVKVFDRLVAGGGPAGAFRSYLFTTVRTTLHKQWSVERIFDHHVELTSLSLPTSPPDPVVAIVEAEVETELATRAFNTLPQRWRTVLRYLEVEGMTVGQVAMSMGMRANAVSALAFRARDALRLAYLQVHVNTETSEECREPASNLAAWTCGRLTRSVRFRVERHLDECDSCASIADELQDLLIALRRSVPVAGSRRGELSAPESPESLFHRC